MTVKPEALADAPRYLRSKIVRGLAAGDGNPIDRTGGEYQAGIIRGFAVITRGEALGHGVWIDSDFLTAVTKSMNEGGGSRVRFTHPGMSSDGLGKKLGKAKNATLDGDVVRADLHFSKASHATPDGDLATYTMDLAEEDPELFGASIVYEYDYHAEREHYHAHVNKETGEFESPDPLNTKNLPHARLAELRAVDVVDEPAANPSGMFHVTEIPAEATALMRYAFELTDDRPDLFEFANVHPDRLRGFASRFLSNHKEEIMSKLSEPATPPAETTPAPETPPATPAPEEKPAESKPAEGEQKPAETPAEGKPADPAAEFAAQKSKFTAKFGAVDGCEYLAAGLSYEQACEKHIDKLSAANKTLSEQKKAALAAAGEETPVSVTPAETVLSGTSNDHGDNVERFAAGIKLPGKR